MALSWPSRLSTAYRGSRRPIILFRFDADNLRCVGEAWVCDEAREYVTNNKIEDSNIAALLHGQRGRMPMPKTIQLRQCISARTQCNIYLRVERYPDEPPNKRTRRREQFPKTTGTRECPSMRPPSSACPKPSYHVNHAFLLFSRASTAGYRRARSDRMDDFSSVRDI